MLRILILIILYLYIFILGFLNTNNAIKIIIYINNFVK